MMKSILAFCLFLALLISPQLYGQTKTTKALDERFEGISWFFYRNTLRMLNQVENKEFDQIIRNIEKMKFLVIDKADGFSDKDYKKLLAD